MKRYIIASLMVVAFAAQAQTDATTDTSSTQTSTSTTNSQNNDISGSYTCSGTSPDNVAYQNIALTITKNNQVYQFAWSNPKMGNTTGFGIATGDTNNIVAASFNNFKNMPGVVVYTPQSDGSLQGSFTYKNGTALGSETCTKGSSTSPTTPSTNP